MSSTFKINKTIFFIFWYILYFLAFLCKTIFFSCLRLIVKMKPLFFYLKIIRIMILFAIMPNYFAFIIIQPLPFSFFNWSHTYLESIFIILFLLIGLYNELYMFNKTRLLVSNFFISLFLSIILISTLKHIFILNEFNNIIFGFV
jgi:hypothetical protein